MSDDGDRPGSVTLTVYLRPDLAEVSRVLQTLVLQPIEIERFDARFQPADVRHVNGLDTVPGPVMRLVVVGMSSEPAVERVTKALNRLVAVYKVRAVQA